MSSLSDLLARGRDTIRRTVAHVPKGVPYHVLNSRRGVRELPNGALVDLDVLLAKSQHRVIDGKVIIRKRGVNTHWKRPLRHGFRDPRGRLSRNTTVAEMTVAEVLRLRADDGYRINTVGAMRRVASRNDAHPIWEMKPDWRWRFVATHRDVFEPGEWVSAIGIRGRWDWFKPAKQAGLVTVLLKRGPVPADVWPHVDVCKSRRKPRNLPAHVTWLGPGRLGGVGD